MNITYSRLTDLTGQIRERECEGVYLLLEGDDPRLDLFQGEVIHRFSRGVGQVGKMRAEICEELSRDDETDVFIDHCEEKTDRA